MFSFPVSNAKTVNLCKAKSKQPQSVTPWRNIHQISIQLSNTITTLLNKREAKPESCRDPLVKRQVCSETINFNTKQINTAIFNSGHFESYSLCAFYLE